MNKDDYLEYIEIDQAKRFGKPTIKGTRITVTDILEMLASGMTQAEVLDEHPNLLAEQVKAALLYAANQLSGAA
ncbi:DUF433 domain-containing protein [Endozoicomonas sp. 4G]|uniref:DUF433 domain-containing protein n=1 Tax=Endozoicomonas sp. 4G TaxID=2872754 RepID=UPI0020787B3A|nr:DUF433 domain-containing protein [Endozoicomonas sp. 4G]